MPASPEVDLEKLQTVLKEKTLSFTGLSEETMKFEIKPVAFGLKSINLTFIAEEKAGGTDAIEDQIKELEEVASVEVTDVRRALG